MNLPQEPLDIRRRGSSPSFATHAGIRTLIHVHGWVTPPLHREYPTLALTQDMSTFV